jgi:alkanesulfonate monooxygenase SsuD/methylene tetrahydromethanopterin reductase-like flavin-dependent oxidoreductase (luciferase family)
VVLAALGERMLRLAGELTDGTATWMVGPKTLAAHVAPVITEAARNAGRPAPRIIVGLPICITNDVAAARARAARGFEGYGQLPSYRAMLDREGVAGPADVAVVGSESEVERQLTDLERAGATEINAIVFGSAEEHQRTLEFLQARVAHDRSAPV